MYKNSILQTGTTAGNLRRGKVSGEVRQAVGLGTGLPVQVHTLLDTPASAPIRVQASRLLRVRSFELKDHLGNVRVLVSDQKDANAAAQVQSYYNYYAFGMEMPNRTFDADKGYRYGFNGKENDKDFGTAGLTQDYGFRLYNPAIAKFLSRDPLAPKYPELTPYQFASNRPIDGIDLDGLEFYYAADGSYLGQVGNSPKIRLVNNLTVPRSNDLLIKDIKAANEWLKTKSMEGYTRELDNLSTSSTTIKNTVSNDDLIKLWDKSNPHSPDGNKKKEYAAYIVLDLETATIYLHESDSKNNTRDESTNDPLYSNSEGKYGNKYLDTKSKKLLIGQVHTHPNTATDTNKDGKTYDMKPNDKDRRFARITHIPVYTIGHNGEVDKITPPSTKIDNYSNIKGGNIAIDALKTKGTL